MHFFSKTNSLACVHTPSTENPSLLGYEDLLLRMHEKQLTVVDLAHVIEEVCEEE